MMMRIRPISALTLPLTLVGGLAALSWATVQTAGVVRGGALPSTFDGLVGLGALLGAWLAAAWLVVGLTVAAVAELSAAAGGALDRLARRMVPPALRRMVHVAAGATVVTSGLTLPASGALGQIGPSPMPELDRPVPVVAELPPLTSPTPQAPSFASPNPTSPAATGTTRSPTGPGPDQTVPEVVVVEPGDTLWHIAAVRLDPHPTNAEIAKTWPRWYAANRTVIGADPDLIFPGQRLQPPE